MTKDYLSINATSNSNVRRVVFCECRRISVSVNNVCVCATIVVVSVDMH